MMQKRHNTKNALRLVAGLLALIAVTPLTARADDSQFSLPENPSTRLMLDGQVIVSHDAYDLVEKEDSPVVEKDVFELAAKPEAIFAAEHENRRGWVSGGTLPNSVSWAREVSAENDVAEINIVALVPPADRPVTINNSRYLLYVPVEVVKGAKYECYTGMHRSTHPKTTGTLTGLEPEGKFIQFGIRHIQFVGGKKDFMIDFCPCGVWGLYQEDLTSSYKAGLVRRGQHYVFVLPTRRAQWGLKTSNKIVFRAGVHDLDKMHLIKYLHYQYPTPSIRRVQFTDRSPVTGFTIRPGNGWDTEFEAWQLQPYNADLGLGWVGQLNGKMASSKKSKALGPIFETGVLGSGSAVYRIAHPDAMVLTNVMLSGAQGASKVMVSIGPKTQTVEIPEGGRKTVILPAWIRNGSLEVELQGERWLISGIVLSMLMDRDEDYIFNRTWWALGREPWLWSQFPEKDIYKQAWPEHAFSPEKWLENVKF